VIVLLSCPSVACGVEQLGSIEGAIRATEREVRDLAQTSAVKDGRVNMEVTKKKRRLNADLDSLLDRVQVKRSEFLDVDGRYAGADCARHRCARHTSPMSLHARP
jgi:hypothetical protein